jgi:hypothetical protein
MKEGCNINKVNPQLKYIKIVVARFGTSDKCISRHLGRQITTCALQGL